MWPHLFRVAEDSNRRCAVIQPLQSLCVAVWLSMRYLGLYVTVPSAVICLSRRQKTQLANQPHPPPYDRNKTLHSGTTLTSLCPVESKSRRRQRASPPTSTRSSLWTSALVNPGSHRYLYQRTLVLGLSAQGNWRLQPSNHWGDLLQGLVALAVSRFAAHFD